MIKTETITQLPENSLSYLYFESLPETGITINQIIEYNCLIQEEKGLEPGDPDFQGSFTKLNIETWSKVTLTGEEILEHLQTYISLYGNSPSTYFLWKDYGHNVLTEDIIKTLNEMQENGELSKRNSKWYEDIINSDPEDIREKLQLNQISPPLLFLGPNNSGLLNLGNVLDGNNRVLKMAKYLETISEEERSDFKFEFLVGEVDLKKYIKFQIGYLLKPEIKRLGEIRDRLRGLEVKKVPREHIIGFFERWYLLLQRIGYFNKGKNKRDKE